MIPNYKPINTQNIEESFVEDSFVDIAAYSNGLILVDMQYYKMKYKDSINVAYVRKQVADMLIKAAHNLPDGFYLKILDAWRPAKIQQYIYDKFYDQLKNDDAHLNEIELNKMVQQFVSKPGNNNLHSTGGAIDVILVKEDGTELNMGTNFYEFDHRTRTDYFEHRFNMRIMFNRRMLYKVMTDVGFVNNPDKWWHFDYGDALWAAVTNNCIKYQSIFELGGLNV